MIFGLLHSKKIELHKKLIAHYTGMVKFEFNGYEYGNEFDIILKFEMNNLKVTFSTDLNNITLGEIKTFQKCFNKKKKECTLYFIDSKKNTVYIEYTPFTSTLKFSTWNDAFRFSDIEDGQNSTDIELKINEEEYKDFDLIIDTIIDHKFFNDDYYSDSSFDDYEEEVKEEVKEEV